MSLGRDEIESIDIKVQLIIGDPQKKVIRSSNQWESVFFSIFIRNICETLALFINQNPISRGSDLKLFGLLRETNQSFRWLF